MQNAIVDRTRVNEYSTTGLDALTHALERLLTRHRSVLKEEGMDRQVENLKCWLEYNRNDFATGGNMSKAGDAWLSDLCDSLKLAIEERQRLEGEGGLPETKEQAEQNEELLKTIHRVEKILHRDSVPQ